MRTKAMAEENSNSEDRNEAQPATDGETVEELPAGVTEREFDQGRQDSVSSGSKVRSKITCGSGTRTQFTLLFEGRGANAQEAYTDFEASVERALENGVASELAKIQAEGDNAIEEYTAE